MKKLVIDQYDDHQRIDKYLKKVLVHKTFFTYI